MENHKVFIAVAWLEGLINRPVVRQQRRSSCGQCHYLSLIIPVFFLRRELFWIIVRCVISESKPQRLFLSLNYTW